MQQASAQTVQLPTFSFFGVGTTVSVPDHGATFMGGVTRAADGSNEFGVPGLAFPGFQNRSIGQERSASNVWVTATIHDFDAMDQALLSTPSPNDFAGAGPLGLRSISDVPLPRMASAPRFDRVNLGGNWQPQPAAAAPVSKLAVEEAARDARQRRAFG